jgi:hypothetical protein
MFTPRAEGVSHCRPPLAIAHEIPRAIALVEQLVSSLAVDDRREARSPSDGRETSARWLKSNRAH